MPSDESDRPAVLNPRDLLRRYGIRPRKGLGQHFLIDRSHLERIVDAAELRPDNVVLEVGPGLGTLTNALAARAGRVAAVEIDPVMRLILADVLQHHDNITLVPSDILEIAPDEAIAAQAAPDGRLAGYKVVANLPYNITSAVLRHLLEARVTPELAVVMVQKEVADRILASPGDLSILAVAVQFYARPSRVSSVPAGSFYPQPKVDSAVLRLDVHESPPVDVDDTAAFFRVVRAGFGQKRKQLRNSIGAGLSMAPADAATALERAGIDPRRRAQTLDLGEWAALTRAIGD